MAKKQPNPSWWQYPDRSAFYGTWSKDHALMANHGSVKETNGGWLSSPAGIDSKVFKTRQEAMHYVSDRVHKVAAPPSERNPFAGYPDFKACVEDQTSKGARSPGGLCRTIARKADEMNPSSFKQGDQVQIVDGARKGSLATVISEYAPRVKKHREIAKDYFQLDKSNSVPVQLTDGTKQIVHVNNLVHVDRKNPSIGEHLKSAYESVKHQVTKGSQRKKAIKRLKEAATAPGKKLSKQAQAIKDRLEWDKQNPTDKAGAITFPDKKSAEKYLRSLPYPYQGRMSQTEAGKWMVSYRAVGKKKNPEAESDSMYEIFHGREPDSTVIFEEELHVHENLAGLGDLTGLIFITSGTKPMEVELFEDDLKGCMLSCSENGKQLYVNGSVEIDLEKLGYEEEDIKDKVNLGEACAVTYRTQKGFDEFQVFDYIHSLGKREKWRDDRKINKHVGARPVLVYEPQTGLLNFAGGAYEVKSEGIVN